MSVDGKFGCLGGWVLDEEGCNMDYLCLSVIGYDEVVILVYL